jgi:hypothetical protein
LTSKKLKVNLLELYPLFYAFLWLIILCQAWTKDGEYGAPPSLFYIQEQAELRQKIILKYGDLMSKEAKEFL